MSRFLNRFDADLRPETRILYRKKGTNLYLMTNDLEDEPELCPVFMADENGVVTMEGPLLGSLLAHDPSLIPELEEAGGTFGQMNPAYFREDPVVNGLIGQAVGDAFGVPYEFLGRQEVRGLELGEMKGSDDPLPVPSMWGGMIPAGAFSDDTSMTVASMASVVKNLGRIDCDDVMKQFLAWWKEGKYTSIHFPFGLGNNISHALARYEQGVPALECGGKGFYDNGNGALMRIFPFAMYCIRRDLDDEETLEVIRKAAGITHAHEINALSCFIYTRFLRECLRTRNPALALRCTNHSETYKKWFSTEAIQAHGMFFQQMGYDTFDPDWIPESGYVVDSLSVAICSVLQTTCYEDAIKMAVRFGYDTDTNAAIAGSIAGVLYGMKQIPDRWLGKLRKKEELVRLAEQFSKYV